MRYLAFALAVAVAGCGFAADGAGRVRLPGRLERCSIVVVGDLGDPVPGSSAGPLTPGVSGVECDVVRW